MNEDNILDLGAFSNTSQLPNIKEIFYDIPKDKIIIATIVNDYSSDIYYYSLKEDIWYKIAESEYYSNEQLLDFALELLNITKTDLINILKARK